MRLTRILLTALVIVALLSTLVLSAYADVYTHDNPGKGHDFNPEYGNNNDNTHPNNHNEEHGWLNHSGTDTNPGGGGGN